MVRVVVGLLAFFLPIHFVQNLQAAVAFAERTAQILLKEFNSICCVIPRIGQMTRRPAAKRLTMNDSVRTTDCRKIKPVDTVFKETTFASAGRSSSVFSNPFCSILK